MNFPSFTSLKLKLKIKWKLLIVFFVFTLFVVILANTLWIISTRSLLREKIIDSHNELAQHASFLVNNFMGAKISNLVLRSQTTAFLRKNIKDAQFEMSVLLLQDGDIHEASFLDMDGAELVKLTSDKVFSKEELTNQSKSFKFRVASFRYGQEYIGPVYFSPDGDPMITIAVPIVVPLTKRTVENISVIEPNLSGRLPGDILGVLSAEINLNNLLRSVSTVNVGQTGYVYVVDENHNLIAHPSIDLLKMNRDVSGAYILKKHAELDKEEIQKLGGHPEQDLLSGEGPSESGVQVLATYIHIPLLQWGVVVQESVVEVFAEIYSLALYSVLLSFLVVLLAIVVAFFFSGAIVRPIEALHTATVEFGKGNLGYRAKVQTRDEIGDLADSFNATADALANTVQSLKNEQHVISTERNKLSVILSGITSAVVAVNMDRKIILFNKAAETLTGVTTESVLGSSLGEVLRLFDGDRALSVEEICPIQPEALEGSVFKANNLKMKDASGAEHFVNIISGRVREGESINLGCILTFQDITREFIMERTKREFVTIAAHQLRTPLTGMSWMVEMLLSETKGALNAAQKELVALGLGAVHRMVELVNDLLDVSRIEEGRFGIKLARQSLAPILSRATDIFKKAAQEKNIEFATDISPTLPEFEFDANKMEFVINNILDNAVNYTPAGGHITFRAAQKDNDIVISVKDTGIGITKTDAEYIFKKFFRSREAFSHFTDGSGLGLYVAKNIIDQHGGKIWFESDEGKGTTFYVSLPLSRALMPNAS